MKVVILCGGMGTRLSEETVLRPKPMVTVGERPLLWHIMNSYGAHGFNEFVLALGYKAHVIKEYFLNYYALNNDFRVSLSDGSVEYLHKKPRDWKVNLIETGEKTLTGGRIRRLEPFLRPSGTFMVTYGDGVSDVNIKKVLDFHRSHGKIATVTAVHPPARFGEMQMYEGRVDNFREKPQITDGWINGGYFVFEPQIFDYLDNDECILERTPLEKLSAEKQLMAYQHGGFWQCVDTVRDLKMLEEIWNRGNAPWSVKND